MRNLGLFPAVGYWLIDGDIFLDRKFYDGLALYKKLWEYDLTVFLRQSNNPIPKFGLVQYKKEDSFFTLVKLKTIDKAQLTNLTMILASADEFRNLILSRLCEKVSKPCIYYVEYILETRLQINWLSSKSSLSKLKSSVWLIMMEIKRRSAFRLATGLQANGMPAYSAYRSIIPTLLYFDTRSTEEMIISEHELDTRLEKLAHQKKLRMAFSGRINKMKGADDLISLAKTLVKKNCDFQLDIFGDGELYKELKIEIANSTELSKRVILHGAVSFADELIPYIKEHVDLFVCCHKQSDPSCTYLETYSCGVPIVGYNNKAHSGILELADVGWDIAMNDIEALARKILEINTNRLLLAEKSRNARVFAKDNTFMVSFQKRINSCLTVDKKVCHN